MIYRFLSAATIGALMILAAPQANAEILGSGNARCSEINGRDGLASTDTVYAQWFFGYVSSAVRLGVAASGGRPTQLSLNVGGLSMRDMLRYAERYCSRNPDHYLAAAASTFVGRSGSI